MAESKVIVFGKQNCVKCTKTKHRAAKVVQKWGLDEDVRVIFMDMETLDGLTEGAYRDVWEIPTTIIESAESGVVHRSSGEEMKSAELTERLVPVELRRREQPMVA
jgi:hypothetical protein